MTTPRYRDPWVDPARLYTEQARRHYRAGAIWIASALLAMAIVVLMIISACRPRGLELNTPGVVPGHDPIAATQPAMDIIAGAPRPTSAAEGVGLNIFFTKAMAGLARQRDELQAKLDGIAKEKDAEISVFKQKAETADKAMGRIGWAAGVAFLAVIPAWFIGGLKSAIKVCIIAVVLSAAPMIISELWADVRPYAGPICGGAAIVVAGVYLGQWLYNRWVNKASNQQANRLRLAAGLTSDARHKDVLLAQASLLDHVGTKRYDPMVITLPKHVQAGSS